MSRLSNPKNKLMHTVVAWLGDEVQIHWQQPDGQPPIIESRTFQDAQLAESNERLMAEHQLRWCICADPENCREPIPGVVCRAGKVNERPVDD